MAQENRPRLEVENSRKSFKQRLKCLVVGCRHKAFKNLSGRTQHMNAIHRRQRPNPATDDRERLPSPPPEQFQMDLNSPPPSPRQEDLQFGADDLGIPAGPRTIHHPILDGTPCDEDGFDLPPGAPPPPRDQRDLNDWEPYESRIQFELAEFLFKRSQMPQAQIDSLLELWAATLVEHGDEPPFADHNDLHAAIDSTKLGDVPWQSFTAEYTGARPATNAPTWMDGKFDVCFRDPKVTLKNMLSNPDFDGEFDYAAHRDFGEHGERRYTNLMSGDWAWQQSDTISDDVETHGSLFVPIVLGSDKTTVSVATGQNDYYPLYMSIGNVHNGVRRAHRGAVAVIGFLAMPKSERKYDNDPALRNFRRQLFHDSLAAILEPLRAGMKTPEIMRCPDGHYRRVIFGLGPYIADYPEQVLLTCIVQGWCPKCTSVSSNLDNGGGGRRTPQHTKEIVEAWGSAAARENYGIVAELTPFTTGFPRANIYELIAPDLLHQIIKGTFKDHLVTWVGEYLVLVHGEAGAAVIMSDIDRRIAAVPSFPALRRFNEGRGFKQWTGDDSKALMKVYLPAIVGHVPSEMVKTLSAFLDLCYLLRRSVHDDNTLQGVDEALARFHEHRKIFQETGVRPKGISLPRQHSVFHYRRNIELFGAPNGLCSSITESKHIEAVKKPWRRSNHYNALSQMLLTNQRLDKLAASRADFEHRGMLKTTSFLEALVARDQEEANLAVPADTPVPVINTPDIDAGDVDGPKTIGDVQLAHRPQRYPRDVFHLSRKIGQPRLLEFIRRFLADQLLLDQDPNVPLSHCPPFSSPISVYHFATATFYAPSDLSGINGMRRERIYANPCFRRGPPRYDCVFIETDATLPGMRGLHVARVKLFFSFRHENINYPCALVEWFVRTSEHPDDDTGMWIVQPEFDAEGDRAMSVVHLDTVLRGAHLIGFYGDVRVPPDLKYHHALDAFDRYYVNKFIDHHANEIAF